MELVVRIQLAAERLFSRFGVKSVTMDDVAKEIFISKKTLYKCFRDKDSLVRSTVESHIRETDIAIEEIISTEPNPILQFKLITQHIIENQNKINPSMIYDLKKYHPNIFVLFEEHNKSTVVTHVTNNILNGQNLGLYRKEINTPLTSVAFSLLTLGIFENERIYYLKIPQENILLEIVLYHLRAISTPKGVEMIESIDWKT